jgi:dihydropteroate synthase
MEDWDVLFVTSDEEKLKKEITAVGADTYAINMWEKGVSVPIKVFGVPCAAANIIKQEALASGIDAAVHRSVVSGEKAVSDVLVLGSLRGVKIFVERLRREPFRLKYLADRIETLLKDNMPLTLSVRGRELVFDKFHIMGILNVTPDSFSDGGKYTDIERAKERVTQIFEEGASIVDIGGVSTRPGYTAVAEDEELRRVLPVVRAAMTIASQYGGFVSVDTFNAKVAKYCLDEGIHMINDQSALADEAIGHLCAKSGAAIVLMGGQEDIADPCKNHRELIKSCKEYIGKAQNFGIENAVIDPGFGFGKNVKTAYYILKHLKEFQSLKVPILVGVSKKSMLGAVTGRDTASRGFATVACETVAMLNGANIIRTHDVAATKDAAEIAEALKIE